MGTFFHALPSFDVRFGGMAILGTEPQGTAPVVLSIPPATLDQLRAGGRDENLHQPYRVIAPSSRPSNW